MGKVKGIDLIRYFNKTQVKYAKSGGQVKRSRFRYDDWIEASDVIKLVAKFLEDQELLNLKDKTIKTVSFSVDTSLLIVDYEYNQIREEFDNRAFTNSFEVHTILERANT